MVEMAVKINVRILRRNLGLVVVEEKGVEDLRKVEEVVSGQRILLQLRVLRARQVFRGQDVMLKCRSGRENYQKDKLIWARKCTPSPGY